MSEEKNEQSFSWNISPEMKRKLFKEARERGWPKILACRYANMSKLPDGRSLDGLPLQEYLPEAAKLNKEWDERVKKGNFRYTIIDNRKT